MTQQATTMKAIEAYDKIRELILTGRALPGSRLVISELETLLKMGKGPIREALMRLDKSGLVENVPHKGALVIPPPSLKEMKHIYQTRIDIECLLAVEANQYMQTNDLQYLQDITLKMTQNKDNDFIFFELDKDFHSYIYRIAKMPHLQATVGRLMDSVDIFFNTYHYKPTDKDLFLTQHVEIIEAFKEKNADLLKKCLQANIAIGFELIREKFQAI